MTALVAEAAELGVYAVCVSPSMVAVAQAAAPAGLHVAVRRGISRQANIFRRSRPPRPRVAVAAGADEIDMVIDVGAAVSGDFDAVRADVAAVRAAVPDAVLKVIVESAAMLSLADEDALTAVCRVAAEAGADFVKTSTGFHPSGGASVHAVELMAAAVGPRVGVKASGGIRTADDARRDAGCRRDPPRALGNPRGARRVGQHSQPAQRPAKQGSSLPAGIDAFLVEKRAFTPVSVTLTSSAWMPSG